MEIAASLLVLNDFVTVHDIEVPIQLEEDEIRDYLNLHMNQFIRYWYLSLI